MSSLSAVDNIETNLSALSSLIGEDNVEDIKKKIAEFIVDRVAKDINDYNYYLFYPPDYQGVIESAFNSIEKKIIKMYKETMLEVAQESVNRFKDLAITDFNKIGFTLRSCHKCMHRNGNRCAFYEMLYWNAHDSICAEEGFVQFTEKENI